MRIAVIGAGAMGSLFGALLSTVAGVWLVTGWREQAEAIRRHGLHLLESTGEKTVTLPVALDPAEVGPVDLAIIFVKSHQTEQAARKAQAILKPSGLALTLQNGLGNREVLAETLGEARAWQGVTAHGATLLGPGYVRHAGTGPTHLETRPEIAARAAEVASLFTRAGLDTHLSDDLAGLLWGKLLVNAGINALTAILRVPNGALARSPAADSLMARAVAEAAAVAKAKGIKLPYADPVRAAREVATATAANRSSMLQDVLRGSRTEVDVINGAIVREAGCLGLGAPVNEFLAETVKALEDSYGAILGEAGKETPAGLPTARHRAHWSEPPLPPCG